MSVIKKLIELSGLQDYYAPNAAGLPVLTTSLAKLLDSPPEHMLVCNDDIVCADKLYWGESSKYMFKTGICAVPVSEETADIIHSRRTFDVERIVEAINACALDAVVKVHNGHVVENREYEELDLTNLEHASLYGDLLVGWDRIGIPVCAEKFREIQDTRLPRLPEFDLMEALCHPKS